MSTEDSSQLSDLFSRSEQSKQLINSLKKQIAQIKLETSPEFMANKAKRIEKENEELKKKIEALKKDLGLVESGQGFKYILTQIKAFFLFIS